MRKEDIFRSEKWNLLQGAVNCLVMWTSRGDKMQPIAMTFSLMYS